MLITADRGRHNPMDPSSNHDTFNYSQTTSDKHEETSGIWLMKSSQGWHSMMASGGWKINLRRCRRNFHQQEEFFCRQTRHRGRGQRGRIGKSDDKHERGESKQRKREMDLAQQHGVGLLHQGIPTTRKHVQINLVSFFLTQLKSKLDILAADDLT